MRIVPLARAMRCVSALADTSTMCAWPCGVEVGERAHRRRVGTGTKRRRKRFGGIIATRSPASPPSPRPSVPSLSARAASCATRCVAASPGLRPRRRPDGGTAPAVGAEQRCRRSATPTRPTSASAPSASSATRSCARSARPGLPRRPAAARVPAVASGSRWWRRRARSATSRADIDQRFAWEPFLVRDRSVNAFALPGGYVGVHLGLIAITATRDELASVLGARAVARHAAPHRAQHRQQRAAVAGRPGGDDPRHARGRRAATAPTRQRGRSPARQAAAMQGQLNFSRDMEREADRIGFRRDDRGRLRARRHGRDVREAGQSRPASTTAAASPTCAPTRSPSSASARRARAPASARAGAAGQRARAHRRAGARAGADGHARRRPAPLAGARRRRRRAGRPRSCWPPTPSALGVDACCATGRVPTPPSPTALGARARQPERSARAERAVVLLQAQSLLARGDAGRAAEALQPYAGDGSRPVLLLACADRRWRGAGAVSADSARAAARVRAADLGRAAPATTRSPGPRSARPGRGSASRCARCAPRPSRASRSAT